MEIRLRTWTESGPNPEHPVILVVNACASRDVGETVVGVCFVGQDVTGQKTVMDQYTRIQGDYTTIVQARNSLIPPIFGSDELGFCSEWNPAMEQLTGLWKGEVMGKMLTGDIFGPGGLCRLRNGDGDGMTKFMIVLNNAMDGQDTDKFPFAFVDRHVSVTSGGRGEWEGGVGRNGGGGLWENVDRRGNARVGNGHLFC